MMHTGAAPGYKWQQVLEHAEPDLMVPPVEVCATLSALPGAEEWPFRSRL